MARRQVINGGFVGGVASGVQGQVEDALTKRRELANAIELAKQQAALDPEKQARSQAMNAINRMFQTPQPMGGYHPQEEAGIPQQVADAGEMRRLSAMQKFGVLPKAPLTLEDLEARSAATAAGRQSVVGDRQKFMDSTKLRQEFLDRPETKEYVTINTNVRTMDSMLQKSLAGDQDNKVALDQALISLYNKLTDPQSVVRESEYARTPGNLPFLNRWSGAMEKVMKGGAGLTDADRQALVWGAKVIANERGRTYNDTLQGYQDLSGQYDFDINTITRGLNPHQPYEVGTEAPATVGGTLTKEQAKAKGAVAKDNVTGEWVDADGNPIR